MVERVPERGNGGLVKMDSSESRWVFQEQYDAEEDGGNFPHHLGFDSEVDENGDQKLVRTGPRIDSFDVEALEVPGVRRNDYEVCNNYLYA